MPRLKMKLGQTSRQFQIIQRVFHNKILNTKTVDLTQGTFTAVQLAQDHVSRCVQQIELLQEVSVDKTQVVGSHRLIFVFDSPLEI